MKLKSYLLLGLATLALASCDESFNDWASPATNEQGAIVSFGNGSITEVPLIDFATAQPNEAGDIQVCQVTAPTANPDEWANAKYTITFNDEITLDMTANGEVNYDALREYVTKTYGVAPEEYDLTAKAVAYVGDGKTAVKMVLASSDPFNVKVKQNAPFIDEKYYLIGNINGWDPSNTDYVVVNNGGNRYENPEFTITLDATGEDIYFKVCPAVAIGTGDDAWAQMLTALDDTDVEVSTIDQNYGIGKGGAFKVTAAAQQGFKKIKLTFNLMKGTYRMQTINFDEFIYGIGNGTGWSRVCPVRCENGDGEYSGFIYIDGGWKFRPLENDWGGTDWGGTIDAPDALTGTLVEGGDIPAIAVPGYYRVNVSLNNMTWALTEKINTIGVIGSFPETPNWEHDAAKLEYNAATGAWEGTCTFPAGVKFKFRANDDWKWNWGGTADALTQDGPDMTIEAGTYFVQLYAFCNGKAHVVYTKQKE